MRELVECWTRDLDEATAWVEERNAAGMGLYWSPSRIREGTNKKGAIVRSSRCSALVRFVKAAGAALPSEFLEGRGLRL